jgi:hypothetical protein
MSSGGGANRLGDGDPRFCTACGDPFRLRCALPSMGALGDYCPTCLEDYMNGCADTGEEVSTNG